MVNEDYERDYLKEAIYLREQILDLEIESRDLMNDIKREVAKIIVIDVDKQLENGKTRSELLPF
jgi:hypothetical protein